MGGGGVGGGVAGQGASGEGGSGEGGWARVGNESWSTNFKGLISMGCSGVVIRRASGR